MLLMIFIIGCIAWGGRFPRDSETVRTNLDSGEAFRNPSQDAYAFAEAYLAVVFAYGGFNQANYVRAHSCPLDNYLTDCYRR